jgi:integrase
MASIRKRKWQSGGEVKEAWVADYFDQDGKRHIKTFEKKKEAEAWLDDAKAEVRKGTHTADSVSKTVGEAGDAWVAEAEADGLERSTVAQYRQHLDLHIKPYIGDVKLSRLTAPQVRDFRKQLRQAKRSPAMIDKVVTSLGSIVAYALDHGMVAKNVVRDARRSRRRGQEKRQKRNIEIPTKAEIKAMIAKAEGRWRPLIITAIFTGLRASELRGLAWDAIDLDKKVLTVRQRADAWNVVGVPKSDAGYRDVPLAPMVVNTLKEWKLQCPRRKKDKDDAGELVLVFPNGDGNPESHANIVNRGFGPLQVECGMTRPALDEKGRPVIDDEGKPVLRGKYGLHALRHAAASLFIEQGMSPKRVQTIMGHAGIQITFDIYGHLFPAPADDQAHMEQLQARLMASA